jgi:hypothetical protein
MFLNYFDVMMSKIIFFKKIKLFNIFLNENHSTISYKFQDSNLVNDEGILLNKKNKTSYSCNLCENPR